MEPNIRGELARPGSSKQSHFDRDRGGFLANVVATSTFASGGRLRLIFDCQHTEADRHLCLELDILDATTAFTSYKFIVGGLTANDRSHDHDRVDSA